MKNSQFAAEILVNTFLEKDKEANTDVVFRIICNTKGIDRISFLKTLGEKMKNNSISRYFNSFIDKLSLTGAEFMQLKDYLTILFMEGWTFNDNRIHTKSFNFKTFTEEEKEVFLDIISKKDDNGENLYSLGYTHNILHHLTVDEFEKYYPHLLFDESRAYRYFPHHTRETVLNILKNEDKPPFEDPYSWAVGTCLLTEEDLEPYIPQISRSSSCFTKEVKKFYSKDFWFKIFMESED